MLRLFLVFSICIQHCIPQFTYTEKKEISYEIVGIFEQSAIIQSNAFNESAQHASFNDRRWSPIVLKPAKSDSYSVWRELCKDESRPLVIVGPQRAISDGVVRDQCMKANIPHIQASWQPFDPDLELNKEINNEEEIPPQEMRDNEEENTDNEEKENAVIEEEPPTFKKISINFYPDSDEISKAHATLLKYYQWTGFSVLYEDDFGLLRVQKILSIVSTKYPVTVRKLDPDGDSHMVFKELKKYQESRILLDCHVDRIKKYMEIADTLHMVNHYQHYILTSLDVSVVADQLTQYHSNITWLTLTDYDKLKNAQHELAPRVGRWTTGGSPPVTNFQLEALLMDDMANHVLRAVRSIEKALDTEQIDPPRHQICEKDAEPWSLGASLQNEILKTNTTGVSGKIIFDDTGKRVNYTLHVNEISMSERNTVGRWESYDNESIIDDRNMTAILSSMTRKHFIVISRKAKPYFFPKEPCVGEDCPENDEKYEGFSVDLVKAIFAELNKNKKNEFTYEFMFDENNKKTYGHYDPLTKKWDGLIGDLLDKKADLAVCDLSITEERKKVVDFSVPFMSLGISILYTKEHKVVPDLFSFLNPYSFEVWMHTATAYCVVSIILFICARISPADWENPQPCDKDPEELENIWNFKNCAWLTMGSIMTQGCDILPKAVGTRWVCGMWWFFAVIVCQTYIAQLSASMTSAMEAAPINSVEDLAKQNKILYGALNGGSTLEFFKRSKDKTYQKIYETMISNPVVLVDSNDEGEKRVLKGKNKFAFFMESTTIEYKMKRNCELKKVGGELDAKDYGIAMPANSPFRHQINSAILELNQRSILPQIKDKWWGEKYGAKECEDKNDKNDIEGDLEMENLIGAFLVLLVGMVFCLFITAAEFFDEVRNIVVREKVSHKEAFVKELRASLNFFQLQKPVLRNPSRAPSIASETNHDDKSAKRAAILANFMELEKQIQ